MRPFLSAMLAAASLWCPTLASAAPTLSLLDLVTGSPTVGVVQQGAQLGSGSGLMAFQTSLGDPFGAALGNSRHGALGVAGNGGLGFMATDVIASPPAVDGSATRALGLSARGGVAQSLGFLAGVNLLGGLTYFEPLSGSSFSSPASGLFSLGSDLLSLRVNSGQSLFGQDNTLGSGPATGLMGTTGDGRLRLVRTDGSAGVGAANQLSRPLGFAPDTGLAAVGDFIVGINTQGSLNVYDPFLDLLFQNVGPAGLFSATGGLDALNSNEIDGDLFDVSGDLGAQGRGVIGITAQGSLTFLRLDVFSINDPNAARATLRSDIDLDLDPDSGLFVRNGVVTAMSAGTEVPEPGTAALVAAALMATRVRRFAWTSPHGLNSISIWRKRIAASRLSRCQGLQ